MRVPAPRHPAPNFTAIAASDETFQSATLRGLFCSTSDMPACTAEACRFRDSHASILERRAVVPGGKMYRLY